MEIYVLIDNRPQGPYTPELIRKYLSSGQLQPTDLAAYAGQSDWKPLSTLVAPWGATSAPKPTRPVSGAWSPSKAANQKPLWVVVGVVVALIAVAGVFFLCRSLVKAGGSSAKVTTAADPSWPNSLADWNAWYAEPPEGQNAASFYAKGFQAFQFTDADQKSTDLPVMGQGTLPPPGTPLSPTMKASITDLVQRNQPAWGQFKEGAGFEQARYSIDLNLGPETLLPHLAKIKKAAQFAQLQSILNADNKDSHEAADTLLVSLSMAQSLKNEPVLISQLVRIACFAIHEATLQQVMNSAALSPSELEELSTALSKAEATDASGDGFTRAFVGERASTLWFFGLPPDKLEEQLKAISQGGGAPPVPVREMMRDLKSQKAFAEETFNHAMELRKQPFPNRLKSGEYFNARAVESKKDHYYICQLLLAALGNAGKREAMGLGDVRLMRTAIALEQFRQAHGGAYPDSLSALVPAILPEVPADPIQGGELHYQRNREGYELQSTGRQPGKPLSFKIVRPPT